MCTENQQDGLPLLICMVGLPARGKSFISRKIQQYFNWLHINTKVFNLGEYRRQMVQYSDHSFFEQDNVKGMAIRDACLENALEDLKQWIQGEEGQMAIIDATNTALDRRKYLCKHAYQQHYDVFFVESFCNDPNIVDENITQVKIRNPDYAGKSTATIVSDFKERIRNYEVQYTPLDAEHDSSLSFIRIIDAGKRVEMNNINTSLKNRIVRYLISIRLPPQTFYISRHGESTYNFQHRIGGDPTLSPQGRKYATTLAEFINGLQDPRLKVWTSSFKRAIETASLIKAPQKRWNALNEIQVGICSDMTYDEIKEKWPDMVVERTNNKFYFRYPGGESYQDLIQRLESFIFDLEQETNVCIITHRAVVRCLLGYFSGSPPENVASMYVPLHTLFKVTTTSTGCQLEHIQFPIANTELN